MFQGTIGNKLVIVDNDKNTWNGSNVVLDKFLAVMDSSGSIAPRTYTIRNIDDDTYHIECSSKSGYIDRYPTMSSDYPIGHITHQELYCMTTLVDLYRVAPGGMLTITTEAGNVTVVRIDK